MKRIVAFVLFAFLACAASGQNSAPSLWGVVPTVWLVSGDNQAVHTVQVPGSQLRLAGFAPLQVLVRDKFRKPVPNAPVVFSFQKPPRGIGYCVMKSNATPSTDTSLQVAADANGVATLDKLLAYGLGQKASIGCYDAYGPFTVAASYGSFKATFHLTVLPEPWTMTIVSGDNQKQARNTGGPATARFAPLQVALKDSAGKGVPNVQVAFMCSVPVPVKIRCQMDGGLHGVVLAPTDGNGIATLNQMSGNSLWAYYDDGPITVLAHAGEPSVTFHLTVGN
jgi:hypothetical protein